VGRLAGVRVLVLGDLMLDEYIWGEVSRVSPEAPVPVVDARRHTYGLGGAGNVAANILALGGQAFVAGVLGGDDSARTLLDELRRLGADTEAVVADPSRPTTVKTRVVAHSQQIVRIDRESREKISSEVAGELLERSVELLARVDAVVLSDYNKGVFVPDLTSGLVAAAQVRGTPVAVNPKPFNISLYHGATLVSLNHSEAQRSTNREIQSEESLEEVGTRLRERLDCQALLVTRGAQGISLFQREGVTIHLPTLPAEVYDVTGAGDTVVSVATAALAAGGTCLEAALLGNLGGSLKVRKLGASPVTAEELTGVLDGGQE
jgi:D-beta-D-heptose 7-phosphate kinase/D-beta-D-heptose 1-phosphate adenosyltransferase